jgi:hypothetical protein
VLSPPRLPASWVGFNAVATGDPRQSGGISKYKGKHMQNDASNACINSAEIETNLILFHKPYKRGKHTSRPYCSNNSQNILLWLRMFSVYRCSVLLKLAKVFTAFPAGLPQLSP